MNLQYENREDFKMQIQQINGEWYTHLTDTRAADIMGTSLIPLPFTATASKEFVVDSLRSTFPTRSIEVLPAKGQ